LALMVLTAVAGGALTWAAVQAGGLFPSAEPSASVSGSLPPDGLRQNELEKLNKTLDLIGSRYLLPADRQKLLDGALQGMVESLGDPYSVYVTREEAEKFTESAQGAFTGVGADLKRENGLIVVEAPLRGSPAERAGLQPRDIILEVNGESLQGMSLADAAAKIRGPKGTKAKLKVLRTGVKEALELELVRDRISLETVKAEMGPDGIGRLIITQFTTDTAVQVGNELKAMENRGLKALVIDVRNNPGGRTDAVQDTASRFIPSGRKIVQYEYADGRHTDELSSGSADSAKTYPLVVLMNESSASSAEILAGALKQSAGAVLVGETTFGKGTVQISYTEELGDGSLVKLTVCKWLLPDGTWVHHQGIAPDLRVTQPDYWLAYKLPRDKFLKRDMTGEEVKNLQLLLKGIGFAGDRADGYFSEATEQALKSFQQQANLPQTGQTDEPTSERLEEALFAELQKPEKDTQLQAALTKARDMLGMASAVGGITLPPSKS
jgi:carboxyl-terminal processing protease